MCRVTEGSNDHRASAQPVLNRRLLFGRLPRSTVAPLPSLGSCITRRTPRRYHRALHFRPHASRESWIICGLCDPSRRVGRQQYQSGNKRPPRRLESRVQSRTGRIAQQQPRSGLDLESRRNQSSESERQSGVGNLEPAQRDHAGRLVRHVSQPNSPRWLRSSWSAWRGGGQRPAACMGSAHRAVSSLRDSA